MNNNKLEKGKYFFKQKIVSFFIPLILSVVIGFIPFVALYLLESKYYRFSLVFLPLVVVLTLFRYITNKSKKDLHRRFYKTISFNIFSIFMAISLILTLLLYFK